MPGRGRFDVFATKNDLISVFEVVEEQFSVKYVKCGHFDKPEATEYAALTDIADLGYSASPAFGTAYLFVDRSAWLPFWEVNPPDRPPFYVMDPRASNDCLFLRTGGFYEGSNLLPGLISIPPLSSGSDYAVKLFGIAAKEIKRCFERISGDWLVLLGLDEQYRPG